MSKRKRIKNLVEEFLTTSTFHGAPRVVISPYPLQRFFWMVLVSGILVLTLVQFNTVFMRFLSKPTEIKRTIHYEEVNFPAVTFCNLNSLMSSKLYLGGDHLNKVIDNIRRAQEEAVTGKPINETDMRRRRKKRNVRQPKTKRKKITAQTKNKLIKMMLDNNSLVSYQNAIPVDNFFYEDYKATNSYKIEKKSQQKTDFKRMDVAPFRTYSELSAIYEEPVSSFEGIGEHAGFHMGDKLSRRKRQITGDPCTGNGIMLSSSSGSIQSPGYFANGSGHYPSNLNCYWQIQAPFKQPIYLEFHSFNVEYRSSCNADRLKIYDGVDSGGTLLAKLCGNVLPDSLQSSTGNFFLHLYTDAIGMRNGFNVSWFPIVIDACAGNGAALINASSGSIHSPGFLANGLGNYQPDINCQWHIKGPDNQLLMLEFDAFNVEGQLLTNCRQDSLKIYDGENSGGKYLQTLCGNSLPEPLFSSTGNFFLHFETDAIGLRNGFNLSWFPIDEDPCLGPGVTLTGNSGEVLSPGFLFSGTGNYGPDLDCYWKIQTPEAKNIHLMFMDMLLEESADCSAADYVEVIDGGDLQGVGSLSGTFCGRSLPVPFLQSTAKSFLVHFHSNDNQHFNGFRFIWEVLDNDPCSSSGAILSSATGSAQSPGFSTDGTGSYSSFLDCDWTIQAEPGKNIVLLFDNFTMDGDCSQDKVTVYDGTDDTGTLLVTICGTTILQPLVSTSGSLHIKLSTDAYGGKNGFHFNWFPTGTKPCYGQSVVYTELTGSLSSPGYKSDGTGQYENNKHCTWTIIAPAGQNIQVNFEAFDVEKWMDCKSDYVRVYDGENSGGRRLGQYCGMSVPSPFETSRGAAFIEFVADMYVRRNGFMLTWKPAGIDPCFGQGIVLSTPSGMFTSPGYKEDGTGEYQTSVYCFWTIKANPGEFISLTVTNFSIESQSFCTYDHLIIYDGENTGGSWIDKYCGTDIPSVINSTAEALYLKFVSDRWYQAGLNGFKMTWQAHDINECLSSPCQSGDCENGNNSFSCQCYPGYLGVLCETDFDECGSSPCENGASCTDFPNYFVCHCTAGYTGVRCQTDIDECLSSPCANAGSCLDHVNGYQCDCLPGYTGTHCETELDECSSIPCDNGASCEDLVNSYICHCLDGYSGIHCETDIDECISHPCMNSATCEDEVNGYTCVCASGYNGTHCEIDIDECLSSPCANAGSCLDHVNGYQCNCLPGYTGTHCETELDECSSIPCDNGASCEDLVNRYNCHCLDGYSGIHCKTDIDECISHPCMNSATCEDEVNGYTCVCASGYNGTHCEIDLDECISVPCLHNGSCTDAPNAFTCQCMPGYTGILCETDILECISDPCQHGATCQDEVNHYLCLCAAGYTGGHCETDINECASSPCQHAGVCHDMVAGYICQCMAGYTGTHCETEINECRSSPCLFGVCHDEINSYVCYCDDGYTGRHCQTEINECVSGPCEHNGTCVDQVNLYQCRCHPGYTGYHCETEINECVSGPCEHNGTCVDQVNLYQCRCHPGYTGYHCETEINECQSVPCLNDGNCTDFVNGYNCSCVPGWTEVHCETDIDECSSNPCKHNATCTDDVNGYNCSCHYGYTGVHCETDINECQSAPCLHDGNCTDFVNGYNCSCVPGWTGVHCETDVDECFSNPCQHNATCWDNVNGYNCSCHYGYTGVHCETDINECQSAPCLHDGNCTDFVNGYNCSCLPGWTGVHCETDVDECSSNPCEHNSTCTDNVNGYNCSCHYGYTGVHCETDINECQSAPCMHGYCTDRVNGYYCTCLAGYTGVHCETDVDECFSIPCWNSGVCEDKINHYICHCKEGYTGVLCETELNECLSAPCQNHATCEDIVAGYKCHCMDGYVADHCQVDFDECTCGPCLNAASCEDNVNGYVCHCLKGYTGVHCETEIDECASSPCRHAGLCYDDVDKYTCLCVSGYSGTKCQIDDDECASSPCKNGGICLDLVNGYDCTCATGYAGIYCQEEIDECASSPCENLAKCNDKLLGYDCTCLDGYFGQHCEILPPPVTEPPTAAVVQSDQSDAVFEPDVDLSNKPWFDPTEQKPSIEVEVSRNITFALARIAKDTRIKMGHRLEDMLQECKWEGQNCSPLNFTGFSSMTYGNCFTFNYGKFNQTIAKARKPGPYFGLSLLLFVESDEYVAALSPVNGIRLIIHRQDQEALPSDDGVTINTGIRTSVKVRLLKQTLYAPFRNCTKEVENAQSYKTCLRMCQQDNTIAECGCADPAMFVPRETRICSDIDGNCTSVVGELFYGGQLECDCQELCRDEMFPISRSTSEWPGQAYEKAVSLKLESRGEKIYEIVQRKNGIKNNFVKLDVYFDEIKYTVEEEVPSYELSQFLSDVGGVFGIWIGISALSLTEVIQLLLDIFMVLVTKEQVAASYEPTPMELMDVNDPGEGSSTGTIRTPDREPPDKADEDDEEDEDDEDILQLVQRHVFLPECGDYFDVLQDNQNNEEIERQLTLHIERMERMNDAVPEKKKDKAKKIKVQKSTL